MMSDRILRLLSTRYLESMMRILICLIALIAVSSGASSVFNSKLNANFDAEAKIKELGLELPKPSKSLAIYKRIVVVDNIAYLSGHIPIDKEGQIMKGKVGADTDVAKGAEAAKRCALALLATLKDEIGSLNKVKRLIKTTGMVNSTADLTQQPEVINGCSQVIVDIWGDDFGKGARAAVGMASLPRGAICEIEMIFELKK